MSNGINLRTNRELISHQIADLMFIITNCSAGIRATQFDINNEPVANSNDGGPRMALESLLNRAVDRLENILNDGDRWKLPEMDMRSLAVTILGQQVRSTEALLRGQAAQIAAQVAAEFNRPPGNQNNAPDDKGHTEHGE